jgi:hypothetical protein
MTKRAARTERTQAENAAGPELAHLVEPMLAGMSSTRQHLLAWVHAQGLAALDAVFRDEAVALAGPKGRHQAQRTHHHWGTTATELTFGGRRVQVPRPRVRRTSGGEATLPSVARFRARDPLTARMMQQLLAGVSTRQYDASLEARPSGRRTRGSSKSAVSRTVVQRTRQRLQAQRTRRLEGLELVALFMDRDVHPLSRLIEFETGVAVGAMVTDNLAEVSELLWRVFENKMEYTLEQSKPGYLRLLERFTGSVVRLQSNDRMLTETFWNHYHNRDAATGSGSV